MTSYSFGGKFFITEGASGQPRRIRDLCREQGVGEPLIDVSESWVTTTFMRLITESEEEAGDRSTPSRHQVTAQVDRNLQEDPNTLSNNMLQILSGCLKDLTAQVTAQVVWHCRLPRFANEIMEFPGLKHRKTFRVNDVQPLMDAGWLEMTIPERPTGNSSPNSTNSRVHGWRLPLAALFDPADGLVP